MDNHFAPVLESCDVDISTFKMDEKKKCTLFEKKRTSDFVLMKIRYIDSIELDNFIINNTNDSLIMLMFTSSYTHLLKSLELLKHAKICHFDIKSQNIVYDIKKKLPIIIDFGLSIDFNNINMKELYNSFYIFEPAYYLWPLEVHLISYLLHINDVVHEADMKQLAKDYVANNIVLRAFSPNFRKKYEEECYYELSKYIGKSSENIMNRILKYWDTWDNYALSLLYIKLMYYLIRDEEGKIIKNQFVSFFIELCLNNIHPNPKKRLSIEETIKSFNLFLYNDQVDKETVFKDIINQIGENKDAVNEIIKADQKYMTLLTKKTSAIFRVRGK